MPDRKGRGQRGAEAAEAVRAAVDRTFQATVGGAQERAQDLVDEVVTVAGRVREALEEIPRVATADELRRLAERVEALDARLARLEREARKAPSGKSG